MDTIALPAGYTTRAPELADAEQIFDFVSAYNIALVGFPDITLDDVKDELVEPGFDARTDGWLVFGPDGALAGYGWAMGGAGDSDLVDVDVIAPAREIADWLFDRVLSRAAGIGRARGHAEVTVDQGIDRGDELLRGLATEHGFASGTTYHRMRIDHTAPVAEPELPAGAVLRDATDEDVRRTAHALVEASFQDHFGSVPTPYDEWLENREARSSFQWSQLTVLELDGSAVAVCECTDQFIPDEDCGYVAKLGVLPSARGKGLAKFLLRRAFATDASAGRAGTILHVDTNNVTPALGLYTSVGMRPVLVIDVWRRRLSTS